MSLVERDRWVIREGTLQGLRSHKSNGKEKDRRGTTYHAYLFNDLFLLCIQQQQPTGSNGRAARPHLVVKEKVTLDWVTSRRPPKTLIEESPTSSPVSSPLMSFRRQQSHQPLPPSPSAPSFATAFNSLGSALPAAAAASLMSSLSPPSSLSATSTTPTTATAASAPPPAAQSGGSVLEMVVAKSGHFKVYRVQASSAADVEGWLRDFEHARSAYAAAVEHQQQQAQLDFAALRHSASAFISDHHHQDTTTDLKKRSPNEEPSVVESSSSSSSSKATSTTAAERHTASGQQQLQSGKPSGSSRSLLHMWRRTNSASEVTTAFGMTNATSQPAEVARLATARSSLEVEVKELKLKLQEVERKLRVADLRIRDLSTENAELRKQLKEKGLASTTTNSSRSGSVAAAPGNSSDNGKAGERRVMRFFRNVNN